MPGARVAGLLPCAPVGQPRGARLRRLGEEVRRSEKETLFIRIYRYRCKAPVALQSTAGG